MPNRIRDFTGYRSGLLVAIKPTDKRIAGQCVWECVCDCGSTVEVRSAFLAGKIRRWCDQCPLHSRPKKHGMSRSKTYKSWNAMRERCENPRNRRFADYGGRGITVCERWRLFVNFLADMGERPQGKTLDRIDNEKGYSPENCRWATMKEQASNRRMRSFNAETRWIHFDKRRNRWYVERKVKGKKQFLGSFATREAAVSFRDSFLADKQ